MCNIESKKSLVGRSQSKKSIKPLSTRVRLSSAGCTDHAPETLEKVPAKHRLHADELIAPACIVKDSVQLESCTRLVTRDKMMTNSGSALIPGPRVVEYAPAEQFEQVLALGAPARPNIL